MPTLEEAEAACTEAGHAKARAEDALINAVVSAYIETGEWRAPYGSVLIDRRFPRDLLRARVALNKAQEEYQVVKHAQG